MSHVTPCGLIGLRCGVGVSPTLCRNAEAVQDPCSGPSELINRTSYVTWPCNFRVITWTA